MLAQTLLPFIFWIQVGRLRHPIKTELGHSDSRRDAIKK